MPRLALGLEFCGSRYRGWQTQQDGVISVQETVEKALAKVANHPVTLHAAGRTDAGVHACNMIAHFDTDAIRPIRGWIRGTNSELPHDIAIRWLQPMPEAFHARFKAIARRYRYVIYNQPHRPALLNGQVTHHYHPLDLHLMQQAAQKLVGTHDFTSFRAVACQSNQPIRDVSHLTLTRHGQLIVLDIQANGFLHHMVRNIVGVLLEIGEGLRPIEWVDELLAVRDRKAAGITAPPDGLYFINAYYPAEFELPEVTLGPVWLNIDESLK
ncbi:tRNA pseudouridine(38-40) synthase TruA [Aquirhabdus parva]|uniref:tRNA pseudouridine synthase A n=1 Tax=Aquirhabdus parva TaxID=2283318 RepID=A0A345P7J1_9GAMM|nr:tRNA pseudouridine(38-40) synthase TruA [Aquirhabdus parva]AXI03250.1 tRNA pseudouridine(38-40) synthase TruA [Aquirhabdus parva]